MVFMERLWATEFVVEVGTGYEITFDSEHLR